MTFVADGELVTTRSAWLPVATTSAAVALLLAEFGSATAEEMVAVSLIAVPEAVPVATLSTTVKVDDPTAKLASVQLIVPALPTAGVVHDHPVGIVIDWNVVLAGVVSVMTDDVATLGPPFVTVCVYVIVPPDCTGTGVSVLVIESAADPDTTVVTVTLLLLAFGSVVLELTAAVSEIDVAVVFAGTVRTRLKPVTVVPEVRFVLSVHVSPESVHPAGQVSTPVMPEGIVSVSTGVVAEPLPLFVTVCV